jgi:hypothetical protein
MPGAWGLADRSILAAFSHARFLLDGRGKRGIRAILCPQDVA